MHNGKNQRKTAATAQLKTRISAPPVYRPQPTPAVLQRKVAHHSGPNLQAATRPQAAPGRKVIQRNINSTHFEKSAAVDPSYMINPAARGTLYSKRTASPPRPHGLYT